MPPKTITTDFSKKIQGSQAYVILSRIKNLDQLFLLNEFYAHKIYTSPKALQALKNLEHKAINRNCIGRREDQIKILCLNVQNLQHHIDDIKHHPKIFEHNLIFLSESCLKDSMTSSESNLYELSNYSSNFLNVGTGKGLACYSEPNFEHVMNAIDSHY